MSLARRLALLRFWASERAGGLGIVLAGVVIGLIGLTIVPLGPDRRLEGRVVSLEGEGDRASFAIVRLDDGETVRAGLPQAHGCRPGARLTVLRPASLVPRTLADPRGCRASAIPPARETP